MNTISKSWQVAQRRYDGAFYLSDIFSHKTQTHMLISEAADMIRCSVFEQPQEPQTWADLGCGSGTFTRALASLLPSGTIHAVDKNNTLEPSSSGDKGTAIVFQQADFTRDQLNLPLLDGILMANALHYIADKDTFLDRLATYTQPGTVFLIVEYDTDQPVPRWVPYPLKFSLLSDLFYRHGYTTIRKLKERPSVYRRDNLYSALIQRTP